MRVSRSRRVLAVSLVMAVCSIGVRAQQQTREVPAPRNLQVLTPDVHLATVMQSFNVALGVQCVHCHVEGDFASDQNPKKQIARAMLRMLKQVNAHFPDAGNDFLQSRYLPFPEGKQYVTCYTCHRGAVTPTTTLPDWHGPDRAPEPAAPPPAGGGGRRGQGPAGGNVAAPVPVETGLPSTRGTDIFKNIVFLPRDTNTQFVMPAFRAALGVECNFCHVFGARMERGHANERELGAGAAAKSGAADS